MKNKILTISIILVLLSFIFINNNVFAVTTKVPESFLDLIYKTDDYKSGNYLLMVTENDVTKYKVYFIPKNDNLKVYCDGSKIYFNPSVSGVKVYGAGDTGLGSLIGTYSFSSENYMHDSSNLFFAEFDVYTDETYSTLFFQCPLVAEITLAEVMRQAGEQATQEVGQTILVVIVATVGLIIFVIGSKKGLTVLMNGLKR